MGFLERKVRVCDGAATGRHALCAAVGRLVLAGVVAGGCLVGAALVPASSLGAGSAALALDASNNGNRLASTGANAPKEATATAALRSLSTAAVIRALAAEGVGVYTTPNSRRPLYRISAPVTALRVLRSQAMAFSAEIGAGGGMLGAQVNRLVRMPAHAPPFAYLLAAYATSHATAGEELAGKLLGSQDFTHPETIVFPSLIETLFAADAVRAAASGRHTKRAADLAGSARTKQTRLADASGTCASIADWTSSALDKFFSALTVGRPSSPALAFLGGLWNTAVTLARSAVSGIVSALTAPVMSAIRSGLGVTGVASMAISALRNLKLSITATPAYNSFSILPAPGNSGVVRATLGSPTGLDYPPGLTACAKSFGFPLPSLNDASGDKVTWSTQNTGSGAVLATVTNQDDALGSDHSATLAYTTGQESAYQANHGKLITTDFFLVRAAVTPSIFKKLLEYVKGIVLGAVPGGVRIVVGPLVKALTSSLLGQITAIAQPSAFRYIRVTHHTSPCGSSADTRDSLTPASSCHLPLTCLGLLSVGDFPGAGSENPKDPDTDGTDATNGIYESHCQFFSSADAALPYGQDALHVERYVSQAEAEIPGIAEAACTAGFGISLSPVSGIGDEAVVGSGTSQGLEIACGEVRVGTDIFFVQNFGDDASAVEGLLSRVVSELNS